MIKFLVILLSLFSVSSRMIGSDPHTWSPYQANNETLVKKSWFRDLIRL